MELLITQRMPHPFASRTSVAFVLHAVGGLLFFAYLARVLFGPVDLFIHLSFLRANLVQCAVAGAIFYSFSLPLLWRHPLSTGWGIAYAAASLLLLVLVFTPSAGYGAGMMRRVAYQDSGESYFRTMVVFRAVFQSALGVAFLLVQAAFLRRTLRAVATPSTTTPV